MLSAAGGLLIVTVGLNFLLHNAIFERIPMLFEDIRTILSDTSDFDYKDNIPVGKGCGKYVHRRCYYRTGRCVVLLSVENGEVVFRNHAGTEVLFTENDDGVLVTQDDTFADLSFPAGSVGKREYFLYISAQLLYNGKQLLQFYYDETQVYLANTNSTDPMTLKEPPIAACLKGKELIGSMRGYIWSRTIPLPPGTDLVLACWPGRIAFCTNFRRMMYWVSCMLTVQAVIVVDKPHNLYLQIFVNEGGIALLGILSVCIIYLWDCFRLYGGKRQDPNGLRGIAVGLGVAGYLFAGFFNDSTVMTSTIFWILLGVGVGMNRQYRKESVGL